MKEDEPSGAEVSDGEWDEFLTLAPCGHHEQSSAWARAARLEGWESRRISLLEHGRLAAGAQLLFRRTRHFGGVGYLRKGPVFQSAEPSHRLTLVQESVRLARKLQLLYLVVDPAWPDEALVEALARSGFELKGNRLPPWNLTEATLMLDLSPGLEKVRAALRRETRREIRLGGESGLEFREGSEAELPVFFELMCQTAERRGDKPIPANYAFLEALWRNFHSAGQLRLFVVTLSATILSAALVFPFGSTVRFWKYGWSGREPRRRPNHLLYWRLIAWASEHGYRWFEIVQVEPQIARCLSLGEPISEALRNHPLYGPTLFKLGFGGRVVDLPKAHFRFLNNGVHRLVSKVLEHRAGPKLLRRLMNRFS